MQPAYTLSQQKCPKLTGYTTGLTYIHHFLQFLAHVISRDSKIRCWYNFLKHLAFTYFIIIGVARGTLMHVPRRRTGKIFKSSRFGSVTTGYDTLLEFWSAWFTAWVWTACGDMIVQYRVQQNQFLVILVHLRCFVVTCLTSFFVFNTVLCFLVCSLSVCLST